MSFASAGKAIHDALLTKAILAAKNVAWRGHESDLCAERETRTEYLAWCANHGVDPFEIRVTS